MRVTCKNGVWELGARIGGGGFGEVLEARSEAGVIGAAKLVPKEPGAERELLFAELDGVRNVVPIIDDGETDDAWVLVMPRAKRSLEDHLEQAGGGLDVGSVVAVLRDIAVSLADLEDRVVHRDLKPGNVLLLDGRWCLADFGIARYADATTAPDTRKGAFSPAYAAPERWKNERATAATDVYSFGCIAYELLSSTPPFTGQYVHEFREAHLSGAVPQLAAAPASLAALVEECLYKSPQARPSAANLVRRLERAAEQAALPGLAALQEANRVEVVRKAASVRAESVAQSEHQRRTELFEAATRSFARLADVIKEVLTSNAPGATVQAVREGGWEIRLGQAVLTMTGPTLTSESVWAAWDRPAFDVIAYAEIDLLVPADRSGYEGREHSLWFCDAAPGGQERYQWFETAFMVSPMVNRRFSQDPFALNPGIEAAKALWNGMAEWQLAWPFTPLAVDDLDEFIGRWAGWLAAAATGNLSHPSSMPERRPENSFRRS
ncbi:serine/threonine protein kinase [Amycolatopsis sp. WAC 04182]|uniref:protein kinase domain-containing protein n=1 Tax=Amycolatopsis sp. WAC 04182 TaxID=2203198 RepID=UPI000F76E041|nr:serine/threonine-protein kinase [Amycolatopsis sp. WAC 04182]RSN60686.1 serine/threonine protein kinase [Amycolatopsis sp. WAC 04182]